MMLQGAVSPDATAVISGMLLLLMLLLHAA
jgi:hypothetical protein